MKLVNSKRYLIDRWPKILFCIFLISTIYCLLSVNIAIAQEDCPESPDGASNQTEYCLLAPIPLGDDLGAGVTRTTTAQTYIEGAFRLAIAIAGVLAVVMIIVGGVQYMASDAFGKKSEAKNIISNAIWGFALAMGAWIILNTISPGLTTINLSLDRQELGPAAEYNIGALDYSCREEAIATCGIGEGSTTADLECVEREVATCLAEGQGEGASSRACADCVSTRVSIKTDGLGACVGFSGGCYVHQDLETILFALETRLIAGNGPRVRITEAHPPTVQTHVSPGHYNGTCVDFNFLPNVSPNQQNQTAIINMVREIADSQNIEYRTLFYENPGTINAHFHMCL